jgi:hypothetical protein
MAIAWVGASTRVQDSSTSSKTANRTPTLNASVAAGHFVLLHVVTTTAQPNLVLSSSSWTLLTARANPSYSGFYAIYYARAPLTVGTVTYTLDASSVIAMYTTAYSGVSTAATPYDSITQTSHTAYNDTTIGLQPMTVPALSTTVPGSAVVANAMFSSDGSTPGLFTPQGTTYTERLDGNYAAASPVVAVNVYQADSIRAAGATNPVAATGFNPTTSQVKYGFSLLFNLWPDTYTPPSAANPFYVRQNGVYKKVNSAWVKRAGTWVQATPHVRSGGSWKPFG